jgi:hypothetical protein
MRLHWFPKTSKTSANRKITGLVRIISHHLENMGLHEGLGVLKSRR